MAPSSDIPLYNSRIFDSYRKLLRKKYPHVNIDEVLSHARMQKREIADPGHWFSQRQVDRFHDKLVQLTNEPGIAREAGRYAASPDALGPLRSFLLGMVGPEYVFFIINKIALKFTRSSRFDSRRTGPREIELTVTFNEGVRENPRQCENRIGFIEAIFLLFDHDFPEIEHTECIFKGGDVCRYMIRWRPSFATRLLLARRVCSFLLLILALGTLWTPPQLVGSMLFCVLLLLYLALTLTTHHMERKALLSSLTSMRNSSEALLAQVQENCDSALTINEIGKVISTRTDLEDILSSVNQVLLKRLGYGRGIILLADPESDSLVLRGCFGLSESDEERLGRMRLPLRGAAPLGIMVDCYRSQRPVLVGNIADMRDQALPESYALFTDLGVKSFICAPIVCEGESLGVLAVDDAKREGELLQSDLNLIQGVAPVIGVAIRNAMRLANERRLSDQLRKASEQLERRVEERTAELRRANEELEFLYDSVSHDLRTPLRVIYGYGELLLDGYRDILDEAGKEYVDCIVKGGEKMEATLDHMLDLTEIRLAQLDPQRLDLSQMAQRILNDLRITDPKRPVEIDLQQDVVVTADERLLTSVMENLLGNAWKYTASKPVCSIAFGMRDGVCYVRDNGVGFDMGQAERLFVPFQKLHDGRIFAGHGLGLSLVRRILDRMGGSVWGEGTPGEGATFYFTVPCREAGKPGAPLQA